jgi:hypothetical protein
LRKWERGASADFYRGISRQDLGNYHRAAYKLPLREFPRRYCDALTNSSVGAGADGPVHISKRTAFQANSVWTVLLRCELTKQVHDVYILTLSTGGCAAPDASSLGHDGSVVGLS